jgi:hypothetical protein
MRVDVDHYEDGTLRSVRMYDDDGELHNDIGPACQSFYKNGAEWVREYYTRGNLHREDGPACQRWDINGRVVAAMYFLKDRFLSKADWERRVKGVKVQANGETKYISRESAEALGLL